MCLDDTPSEEWRAVFGYEGWYEISDLGRVRRIRPAKGTRAGKILLQRPDRKGYPYVMLSRAGRTKQGKIHRLVALAFIPNPEGRRQVNHRDGIKSRSVLSNLEWATNAENTEHKVRNGLAKPGRNAKLTGEQVAEIRSLRGVLTTTKIALRFNISQSYVSRIHNGSYWRGCV